MPTIRLRFPSNRTLANICVYGAIASVSAVMYMRWRLQDRVRGTEYFQLALRTLRQHKGAVNLLGEPIKESGFDLTNSNNCCDANNAQFEVKVRGSKDKGTIYFWATHYENGWLLDRLELETNAHPNKRFLLKKQLSDTKLKEELDKQTDVPPMPQCKVTEVNNEPAHVHTGNSMEPTLIPPESSPDSDKQHLVHLNQ